MISFPQDAESDIPIFKGSREQLQGALASVQGVKWLDDIAVRKGLELIAKQSANYAPFFDSLETECVLNGTLDEFEKRFNLANFLGCPTICPSTVLFTQETILLGVQL